MPRATFTLAIFSSATLLFLVQPLVGRFLLPVLGGSAGVWNTCMVFFQATLLLGYLYADLLTRRCSLAVQLVIHAGVLATAAACLPLSTQPAAATGSPTLWLLQTLAVSVGPPFFALCATAPLLQRWFSHTRDRNAGDPYFLYAASNAGSMVGLLAYPLLLEPFLSRKSQSIVFTSGYVLTAMAVVGCGLLAMRRTTLAPPHMPHDDDQSRASAPGGSGLSHRQSLLVVALAAVPSSLVLGVTQHFTSDVAAIPLLWVVPLAVYLATFMLAFSAWPRLTSAAWGVALPAVIAPALFFLLASITRPLPLVLVAHLAVLFIGGMMCHRRLHELRPRPAQLTRFYLLMSIGGVVGGAFNALVAPTIFSSVVEYPLAIAALCWLRPQVATVAAHVTADPESWLRRGADWVAAAAAAGAIVILAADRLLALGVLSVEAVGPASGVFKPLVRALPVLAVCGWLTAVRRPAAAAAALSAAFAVLPLTGAGGSVIFQGRSFFGVHRVVLTPAGTWTSLHHGSTLHGEQARRIGDDEALAALSVQPTAYYTRSGPLGELVVFLEERQQLRSVAVIGLGAGTIAAYAKPGMAITFFEIDPLVVRIASDNRFFTYLGDVATDPAIKLAGFLGDGRLRLAEQPPASSDLIVIDAFSSDSIPLHLVTKEAVAMYASRLRPGGLIAFHISNRHFNLAPPIATIARDLGLVAAVRHDLDVSPLEAGFGKRPSTWAVVGAADDIVALRSAKPAWKPIAISADAKPWTDDHANLLGAFNGW
jgi:SAM-dependent methyltransferase